MEHPELTQPERAAYQHLRLEVIRALSTRQPHAPISVPGFKPAVMPMHAVAAELLGGDDGPAIMINLLMLLGMGMHSEAAGLRHLAMITADRIAHRHGMTHATDWADMQAEPA